MQFSRFGQKFSTDAGIISLMDDLGNALADGSMIMMGGGNPARIDAVEVRLRERLAELAANPDDFRRLVGVYDPPQGEKQFIASLVDLLNRTWGWSLSADNIALTNGSQSAFFMLFNLFAGDMGEGRSRHILFPLAPEYIGYADAGIDAHAFRACRPVLNLEGEHGFKYAVDFDALEITPDTAALCVSRPTNPTGNVLTDAEMERLEALAEAHDIPLIVDGAYGLPFPDLMYVDATLRWSPRMILCLSLSKLGLPAVRTGIVIADAPIIRALAGMNAIINLATGSFGPLLMEPWVRSGEILAVSRDIVRPYYQARMQRAVAILQAELGDTVPWRLHRPEGAMFLWLWFPGLPMSSLALYERLKAQGVLVVSGHYFFPGLDDDGWPHRHECIRVTYSQDDALVEQGLRILARTVREVFAGV